MRYRNEETRDEETRRGGIDLILREIRKLHKGQGGFTLIEVLVVMTILGILAAIVSISLLGVTANARSKAAKAEDATVQAAFDAMLSDQQVPALSIAAVCNAAPTHLMTQFPGGAAYNGPDGLVPVVLATHYLRQETTQYLYTCDSSGKVYQSGP
jgi:prepilin-type N-terminal cleavage/methylation domain-containing protein